MWCALVLTLSTALLADCALMQSCESAGSCVFEVRGVSDRVYLDCNEEQQLCSCSQFPYIADVPAWELQTGPSGECRIGETGPCGKDRNMVLECMAGAQCIEGRCRKVEKVGTAKEGEICEETIDCRSGLKCSVTGFYFQPIRRCTNLTYVDNYGPDVPSQGSSEKEVEAKMTTTSKPHHHHHHHKHEHERVPGGKVPHVEVPPNSMEQRQQEEEEPSTSTPISPPVVPTAKAVGGGNGNGGESLRGGGGLVALVSAAVAVVVTRSSWWGC